MWTTYAPAVTAAFLASAVEIVEAFTIVLAVTVVRGPRPAAIGTVLALTVLALLVGVFGPLLHRIPLQPLQLVTGVLLLLFGLRWLRKAVLRMAGVIPLHDEDKAFAREQAGLRAMAARDMHLDWLASLTAFKAVLIEWLEVVFIVIAVGSERGLLVPASLGAAAACAAVLLVGLAVHRPLSRVPENTLKFAVGVMLSGFGLFWCGEGLGVDWPLGDASIVVFAALFLVTGLVLARVARRRATSLPVGAA